MAPFLTLSRPECKQGAKLQYTKLPPTILKCNPEILPKVSINLKLNLVTFCFEVRYYCKGLMLMCVFFLQSLSQLFMKPVFLGSSYYI